MSRLGPPKFDWGGGGGRERKKGRRGQQSQGNGVRPEVRASLQREDLRQQLERRQGGVSPLLGVPLSGRVTSIHHVVRKGGQGRNDVANMMLQTLSEHGYEHLEGMLNAKTEEEMRNEEAAMLSLQQRMSEQEREEFAELVARKTGSRVYFTRWSSPEEKQAHRRDVVRRRAAGLLGDRGEDE